MIIFDEEKYAKDIIKNGFKNRHIFKDVCIVLKYFRSCKKNDEYIKKEIYDLCSKYKKDYNYVKDYKKIDFLISESIKWNKHKTTFINITKNEFQLIKSENNIKIQKLLFVILVLAKYYYNPKHNEYYVNISENDIFNLCNMSVTKQNKRDFMYYITQRGYITPNLNKSIKINFIDNLSENICEIKVGNDMIFYYEKLSGKNVINCKRCNDLILRIANRRTKYCKECARIVNIEKTKENILKNKPFDL